MNEPPDQPTKPNCKGLDLYYHKDKIHVLPCRSTCERCSDQIEQLHTNRQPVELARPHTRTPGTEHAS